MSAEMPVRRVGLLFSGGPAPAANAVISAATICVSQRWYRGHRLPRRIRRPRALLVRGSSHRGVRLPVLDARLVSGIRNRKDIILRTSRANPGKQIRELRDLTDPEKNAKLLAVYEALESYKIDALVSIGGDDTLKTANYLYRMQELMPELRRRSCIYQRPSTTTTTASTGRSASSRPRTSRRCRSATWAPTPRSTKAWYVLEIMGRKAGWLTYAAGMAGEATRMMSVEDFDGEFDIEAVARRDGRPDDHPRRRRTRVRRGLHRRGSRRALPDHQRHASVDEHGNSVLGSVRIGKALAEEIEREYERRTGTPMKVRAKQIGYETRCAEPGAFDVLLGSAARCRRVSGAREEGLTGVMVSVREPIRSQVRPVRRAHRSRDVQDAGTLHRPRQRLLPARTRARVSTTGAPRHAM